MNSSPHQQRKHSKLSASGSERWMACPGSVALSEGLPDKDSVWAKEGTRAHEVLEKILRIFIAHTDDVFAVDAPDEKMWYHGQKAAIFIYGIHNKTLRSEILVETRIHLKFIHPEMFGTFDGAVVDHFGTLHVFDYKYGAGHAVSPVENMQMLFYGIGLAHQYDWNFKRVRLWIIQPRIKGYEGPIFWEIGIFELKKYVDIFKKAVERVERYPSLYKEGAHCHWCKAKGICPLKQEGKLEKAMSVFSNNPIQRK